MHPGQLIAVSRVYVVPVAPPDRLPTEAETILSRAKVPDYLIDHETGCWVWRKMLLRGYPHGRPKPHRMYYERAHGPIPEGWDVHHTCENRACVNPAHLEALDHPEHLRQHKRAHSKLTVDDVIAIRSSTLTSPQLAAQYGVGEPTIWDIRSGKNWKGIGPDRPEVHCGFCGELITEGMRNRRYCDRVCRLRADRARRGVKTTPSRWKDAA